MEQGGGLGAGGPHAPHGGHGEAGRHGQAGDGRHLAGWLWVVVGSERWQSNVQLIYRYQNSQKSTVNKQCAEDLYFFHKMLEQVLST